VKENGTKVQNAEAMKSQKIYAYKDKYWQKGKDAFLALLIINV
jgi:hypothetical protein